MVANRVHRTHAATSHGAGFFHGAAIPSHYGPRLDSPCTGCLWHEALDSLDNGLGCSRCHWGGLGGWTKWLNGQNEGVYFLTTLRCLWEAESLEITWRAFREDVLPNWYHPYVLLLAAVVLVVSAARAVSKPDRNNRWIAASA